MPLARPLPTRFEASLVATVRCTVEHTLLDDSRAEVEQTDVSFQAHVDGDAVRVVGFPEIESEVGTALGRVRAVVSVAGEPAGTYHAQSGHATVEVALEFDPKSFFASTSRVTVRLTSDGRLADPEAVGNPLDASDTRVVLIGEGVFDGGSLDGGRLGLVLACQIAAVDEA